MPVGIAIGTAGAGLYAGKKDRDAAKGANESQERQRAASQEFIERMSKEAKQDLFKLFPEAQQSRQKGLEAGLDLFKQTIPMQMNRFQRGNIAAQKQLAGGLPGIESAFLGTGQPMHTNVYDPDLSRMKFNMPQTPQFAPIAPAQQGLGQGGMPQQLSPEIIAMMEQFGGNGGF